MAFKKTGQVEKARSLWEEMETWPYQKDIFPCVELAKYYEHRLRDIEQALDYVDKAFERAPSHQQKEIEFLSRRKQRLEKKRLGNGQSGR